MRIGIIANATIPVSVAGAKKLAEQLGRTAKLFIPETLAELNRHSYESQNFFGKIDLVFVLGGDGTILSVTRIAAAYHVPIFGINMGHIGFLSETDVEHAPEAIQRVLDGEYRIEERMMLQATDGENEWLALNEFGVVRQQFSRIVKTDIQIDDHYFYTITGDGVLIASPTGSTAYSLSAGGPIISPGIESIAITPVCSHALFAKTLVIGPDKTVTVTVDITRGKHAYFMADGQDAGLMERPVAIRRADVRAKFIRIYDRDFIEMLKTKLEE